MTKPVSPEIQLGVLTSLVLHSHNRTPPAGTAPPLGDDVAAASGGVVKHQRTAPQEHGVSWSEVYEPRTSMGAEDGRPVAVMPSASLAHADGARLRLG